MGGATRLYSPMNKDQKALYKALYKALSAELMRSIGDAIRAKYGDVEAYAKATGRDGGNLRATLLGEYSPALDYAMGIAADGGVAIDIVMRLHTGEEASILPNRTDANEIVAQLLRRLVETYSPQQAAAEACGVAYGYFNKLYNTGKPMIRLAMLCAFAEAAGAKVVVVQQ